MTIERFGDFEIKEAITLMPGLTHVRFEFMGPERTERIGRCSLTYGCTYEGRAIVGTDGAAIIDCDQPTGWDAWSDDEYMRIQHHVWTAEHERRGEAIRRALASFGDGHIGNGGE